MTAIDATGSVVRLEGKPAHIVSLVPSLTEALFSLGAGDRVAGVTQFCEEPAEEIADLPKVGGTKTPEIAKILALQPDLVIASIEENQARDVTALRGAGLSVYVTHFPTVRSAIDGMRVLAALVGVLPDGVDWLTQADFVVRAYETGERAAPVPYFCPIWRRPYMVARRDTYMSDLLALAGGRSVFPDAGDAHYYGVELDTLPALAPAIVLLPDEPYRFAPRHLTDFDAVAGIPAVKNQRIHFVDGKALTWYGPRTADAIEMFARLFSEAAAQQPGR